MIVAGIAAIGHRYDCIDQLKVIAFDWRALASARRIEPALATAHLVIPEGHPAHGQHGDAGGCLWNDGCDPRDHGGSVQAAIRAHGGTEWAPRFSEVSLAGVAAARELGLACGAWGVTKAADAATMKQLKVDSYTASGPEWGRSPGS